MYVKVILATAAIVAAFGFVGSFDAQDEQTQRDHYCEMVALWKADAARGVPANDRAGWPAFRKEVVCE